MTAVGSSRTTSSAWLGPESALYGRPGSTSSKIARGMSPVAISIPLAKLRKLCPSVERGASRSRKPLRLWVGRARTVRSADPRASSRSDVALRDSTRGQSFR